MALMARMQVCFAILTSVASFRKHRRVQVGSTAEMSAGDACDAQWNNMACAFNNGREECYTCGSRINWLVSQGSSEQAARTQVGGEFPSECGACAEAPSTTTSATTTSGPPSPAPPSPPPASGIPLDTYVFIRSNRDQNLKDDTGSVLLTPNASTWEKWVLSDAGNGKVTIRSHRNEHLQDANGQVGLSPNTQEWEQWTVVDAGAGKVAFTSHRGEHLQDNNGQVSMSSAMGAGEAWTIVEAPPPPTPAPPPTFAPVPAGQFSIVVIPDVQYMTLENNGWAASAPRYATPERWYAMGNWVATNKDMLNIKAVVQVGDLAEDGSQPAHWGVYRRGFQPIHDAGIAYSWAPGNHDCDTWTQGCSGWTGYNGGVGQLLDRVTFPIEFGPGRYENMLTLFEADGLPFMIVNTELSWNYHNAGVMDWARQKVQEHPDRWAIFNSHTMSDEWLALAKSHPRTLMITLGHYCVGGEEWQNWHQGVGPNPILEIMVDYQCNQNGFLKYFTIDKAAGTVTANTYNAYTEEFRTGGIYSYTWNFNFF